MQSILICKSKYRTSIINFIDILLKLKLILHSLVSDDRYILCSRKIISIESAGGYFSFGRLILPEKILIYMYALWKSVAFGLSKVIRILKR